MTMEVLADWVSKVSNVVWNGLLLYLLVGTGIVFTIRTRFVQVRKFGAGWKHLFGHFSLNGEKAGKDGMSPFQALTTAIAAQVGTGNIAGAAHCIPAARVRFSGCG
jgi:AGCS family alanine or glycine:cation symporter